MLEASCTASCALQAWMEHERKALLAVPSPSPSTPTHSFADRLSRCWLHALFGVQVGPACGSDVANTLKGYQLVGINFLMVRAVDALPSLIAQALESNDHGGTCPCPYFLVHIPLSILPIQQTMCGREEVVTVGGP